MKNHSKQYDFEDVFTASAAYASRFSGTVGQWLLSIQEDTLVSLLLGKLSKKAYLFDLGGGHAQLQPVALRLGQKLLIGSSHMDAFHSLRQRDPQIAATVSGVVSNLYKLPFQNQSFELVSSVRLLSHCDNWQDLVSEMCRVSSRYVIVDYPPLISSNILSTLLFPLKKKIEGNTRTFTSFRHSQIDLAFKANGFKLHKRRGQFVWPMVLHRKIKSVKVSQFLEKCARLFGLDLLIGNPSLALYEKSS